MMQMALVLLVLLLQILAQTFQTLCGGTQGVDVFAEGETGVCFPDVAVFLAVELWRASEGLLYRR